MSFKVYNGYEVPKMSLSQLASFCNAAKLELQKVKTIEINNLYAKKAVEYLDNLAAGIPTKEYKFDSILLIVSNDIKERQKEIIESGRRHPEVDFESSAVFFITKKDKILCLFYAENKELVNCWEKLAGVKDYHFQNSTDRPEKISEKDWAQRNKDWQKIFQGLEPPSQKGLSFSFTTTETPRPDVNDILRNVPSFEKRCFRVSKEKFIDDKVRYYESLSATKPTSYELISYFNKAIDYLNTSKGKQELKKYTKETESLLIKDVSKSDFWLSPESKIKSILKQR